MIFDLQIATRECRAAFRRKVALFEASATWQPRFPRAFRMEHRNAQRELEDSRNESCLLKVSRWRDI